MLLETESADGEPLLVTRGLNPIENTINSLDVSDFYDKFTAYVKATAEKMGRKPVIVIDGVKELQKEVSHSLDVYSNLICL